MWVVQPLTTLRRQLRGQINVPLADLRRSSSPTSPSCYGTNTTCGPRKSIRYCSTACSSAGRQYGVNSRRGIFGYRP